MKTRQIQIKKAPDVAAVAPIAELNPRLVLAFGAARYFEDLQLGKTLKGLFPNAAIIGCSSAGEITNNAEVHDDTLVLTGASFDNVETFVATEPLKTADQSFKAGEALGNQLKQHGVKSVLVLGTGLNVNGSELVKGLSSAVGNDIVVTGGLAGDGARFQATYTLGDDKTSDCMAVAVGFKGDLTVSYGSQGGWEAFGPERKVTKVVSNILYELDGKSALTLYKEYLGERAKDLPAAGLLYPLSIVDEAADTMLIRTILNIDEKAGSLILAGDISEGSVVRLMHAKSGGLIDGAERASTAARGSAEEKDSLGILISCVGRKLVMGDDIDEEIDAVKEVLGDGCTITGFYSYGEICAFDKKRKTPQLHNQTMTITYLSQP